MSNKEKISFSLLIATAGMLLFAAHKKIGGLLSGGNYSHPHSWKEMKNLVPEFLGFFFFLLFGALIYFFLIKRDIDVICPKCEKSFSASKSTTPYCSDCGEKAEPLEGFYKRHPELLE